MWLKRHKEEEFVILMTLNGPIKLSITKTARGEFSISIDAPSDVKIYRENFSITG